MAAAVIWPGGTIGPLDLGGILDNPHIGSPPPTTSSGGQVGNTHLAAAGMCYGGPGPLGTTLSVMPLAKQSDLYAWGQGTPNLLIPPRDPVQYAFVQSTDESGNPIPDGLYMLMDTTGAGFPPFMCPVNIGTASWAEVQQLRADNTKLSDLYPILIVSSPSPSPSPSPSSPPVSPPPPLSPPPPPPPPPPGCIHVCIDSWPGIPASPPFPPPPSPPPAPPPSPSVPVEPVTPGYQIPAEIASCMPNSAVINAIAGRTFPGLLQELGVLDDNYQLPYFQSVISTYQNDKSAFGKMVTAIAAVVDSALNGIIDAIDNAGQVASAISGCGTTDVISATLGSSILGFFQKWIAELPAPITAPWVYYSAWACPVQLPSHEWANEAYARTFITQDQWSCLTRANGMDAKWQEIDVRLRGKQPTEDQLLLLWRKGYFENDADFYAAMNVLGWVDANSIAIYTASQAWVPSPTDAIEWMIKDVSDTQIQQAFGLEAEFGLKYTGATKDALDYNGISLDDAKNLWRAHWRNMAPTTLYELHKRLRPGWIDLWPDAEVTAFVAAICPAKRIGLTQEYLDSRPIIKGFRVPTYCDELPDVLTQRRWLNSLITDGFDVSEALGQADYPAIWRARLLALSYKVMTRVDVRRAYEVGALTPEQAVGKFQDQGHSPPDSITLLDFYRKAAIQLHSRRPICNQWVKTGYDINLLKQSLISQGMREDMAEDVGKILVLRRKIHIQQECMEGIHKRYVKGMIDETGAKNELLNIQFPIDQVADVVNEWTCVKASKPKTETVAEICNEFRAGILTGKQAQKLIVALGYSPFAARRILSLCYLQTPPKTRRHAPIPGSPLDAQMQAALDS